MANIKTFLVLLVILLPFGESLYSQKTSCAKGDAAFQNLRYHQALTFYTKCADHSPKDKGLIYFRIGECHRVLDKFTDAMKFYQLSMKADRNNTKAQYYYANMLLLCDKKEQFNKVLDSLIKVRPYDKDLKGLQISGLRSIGNDDRVIIKDFEGNDATADFSPAYFGSQIVFGSTRLGSQKSDKFTGQSFSQLYSLDTSSKMVSSLEILPKFKYNIGCAVFTKSGDTVFFSANVPIPNKKTHETILQIYTSHRQQDTWSNPVAMPFISNQFNYTHPAISPDGKTMVFASDKDKKGSYNLYQTTFKRGIWSNPLSLGNKINTGYNEAFPVFIHSSLLVYSSDAGGRGLDMLKTENINGKWQDGQILVAPFNSLRDDYGLISMDTMKTGYFTSNRYDDDGNEDIYRFERVVPEIFDSITTTITPIDLIARIPGIITDKTSKSPIPLVDITVTDLSTNESKKYSSDSLGLFHLSLLHDHHYSLKLDKPGYYAELENSIIKGDTNNITGLNLTLDRIKTNQIFVLKDIYYDFDDWRITPASEIELNRLYQFLTINPTVKAELSSHTDSRGNDTYNMDLSHKRAKSVVEYMVNLGIDANRLVPQGYGETRHVNKCKNKVPCSEEDHQLNRRTEIKILSF